jgi:hypothetical protein
MKVSPSHDSDLQKRIRKELDAIPMVDCHEHLQRDRELPTGDGIHIGRFFEHYASCDLVSAGMPAADMNRIKTDPSLSPKERWRLLNPWYGKAWNTAYAESLRIALRDIYGVEDFSDETVDALTTAMRRKVGPGFTRQVFDRAGIDFSMNNLWGPRMVFNADMNFDCFIPDMRDEFTEFPIPNLARETDTDIHGLDDYLRAIDICFERYGRLCSAFKVGRAYDRTLFWEDVPKSAVEKTFNRLLAFNDRPDRRDIQALEDFILHYLCRKCGESGIRMKFHTGIQEGNGNIIANSRAALMANLFLKYPQTGFDIYHISYPYQDELVTLAKNFPNVTVDFCWMWIINPAASRRALSEMLDALPANKIHGFGGDYIFVEGAYGHAVIAKREIARVLAEKVEEGRFSEEYALRIARMILRENPIENFDLKRRRAAYRKVAEKT